MKHNLKPKDRFTYEAVQDLKFLDTCIMKTIRKYPRLPFLNRECTEDYPVPGTNHIIAKGTPVLISLLGIQRDLVYFPNGYDPPIASMNYDQAAYMPFGEGPRPWPISI
ncbi:GM15620 [Drosophila sechellia]|uniref:GM15620 n=1 Tax=Drosophila sechellia TaxID=7238 RepID=B4I880_DROSE|nr:GM15620 [Drosophila sechellia]